MHPSTYSQAGRRRSISREVNLEASLPGNEDPRFDYLSHDSLETGPRSNRSISDSNAKPAEIYYYPISFDDGGIDSISNSKMLCQGNDELIVPIAGDSFVASSPNNTQESCCSTAEGGNKPNGRERRRSGSWLGVDESDDDLEVMRRVCSPDRTDNAGSSYSYESTSSVSGVTDSVAEVSVDSQNHVTYRNCDSCSLASARVDAENLATAEEQLKRNLKFFFMNPVEKWQAKRRFPWKLLVQIIKILIVTAQLCMFATQRYSHVTYLWDTKISFSHLFIKGWESSREATAYPPATGPLALYKIADFFDFLDYAILTFAQVETEAIGAYKYQYDNVTLKMPKFCISKYVHEKKPSNNLTLVFTTSIKEECVVIPSSVINTTEWSTEQYLRQNNISADFDVLLDASFSFSLKTVKLRPNLPIEAPECYSLETTIFFNNNDHDGQMLVDLDIGAMILDCEEVENVIRETTYLHSIRSILNVLTICICFLSLVMCLRAIYRALILRNVTNKFFKVRFNRMLTNWEKFEFINLWYVLICFNDTLIIMGSVIKMGLESEKERFSPYLHNSNLLIANAGDYEGYLDKWNVCSFLLGLGNLFIWFGCLRYLGFFETYNVLILTIKSCFPNVLRYSICILMVFAGYSFCGWLVLGPYHLKFRSLSSTMECLYSLVNGDDMFATFSLTVGKDWLVWWFSRIYLYSFISLFIYVILSLFIAIIMDSYETIKSYYENGFPKSDLVKFASECQHDPHSGAYHDGERTIQDFINHICCCFHRRTSSSPAYNTLPS